MNRIEFESAVQLTLYDPKLYTVGQLVLPDRYRIKSEELESKEESTTSNIYEGEQLTLDEEISRALDNNSAAPIGEQQRAQNKRKRAFGGFLKPAYYDPSGEHDLDQVTETEKSWMRPSRLRRELFSAPRMATSLRLGGVSVNAVEYGKFIRSPQEYAAQAYSSVLGENDLSEEKIAAAKRAVNHQLSRRLTPMEEHLSKLQYARGDVLKLLREERSPGFAHKSPEWMTENIATTWLEFMNILHVIRQQRGWDNQTAHKAEAALIAHLVTGSQRTRVGHWIGMTRLAVDYLDARIGKFSDNVDEVKVILQNYPLPEDTDAAA